MSSAQADELLYRESHLQHLYNPKEKETITDYSNNKKNQQALKQAAGANPEDSATPRSLLPGLASYSPNPLTAYNVEKLPASGMLKQPPNLRYSTHQSIIFEDQSRVHAPKFDDAISRS